MADLITVKDLQDLDVEVDTASPRVQWFITAASDAVIDAAGSPILETRSTVELTAMPASILPLPGLPIRQVHSVSVGGVPISDWTRLAGGLHRAGGWSRTRLESVTVDYTHGLPAVPADIKDLVARMVIAALLASQEGSEGLALNNGQLSSVAIDDYKEAYATGADVEAITEMALPERVRERLAKRFGAGPSVRSQL